jgi:hypothetical protein
MFVILMQWILEFGRVQVNLLGPGFLFGAAEYPAFHILGFDDENIIPRNDNVIDLSVTVICWQCYVLEHRIEEVSIRKELCC